MLTQRRAQARQHEGKVTQGKAGGQRQGMGRSVQEESGVRVQHLGWILTPVPILVGPDSDCSELH